VKLKAHLWSHLDGMASGMGKSPEALLERAVTTLLNLHGYQVEQRVAVATTDPGVPPFTPWPLGGPNPSATRVEGVDKKLPVITGIVSGLQPGLKEVPATANLRAPRQEAPTHALGDEDNEFPTQISLAHTLPRGPFEELADKPLEPVAAGELVSSSRPAEVPSAPPTRFPETSGPEEEPPFVSDVIAVPPELYAPDSFPLDP
jgi:hypothetical protein